MSEEEYRQLAKAITEVPVEHLWQVVDIIQSDPGRQPVAVNVEEIDVEIGELQPSTLQKLQKKCISLIHEKGSGEFSHEHIDDVTCPCVV